MTKTETASQGQKYLLAAFYKFVPLPDYQEIRGPILDFCRSAGICGTILLASEGMNGTIAGAPHEVEAVIDYLRQDPRLQDVTPKFSWHDEAPFKRLKVRLKKEIVAMGVPNNDPNETVGEYVAPDKWNSVITDPDMLVIDVRNNYEYNLGTFKGAVNPEIQTFREFPAWVQQLKKKFGDGPKPKVSMFCTGGIRCEKASAYMIQEGFSNVYHLEGGILKYLETMDPEVSHWDGDCFVFDERSTLVHGLKVGSHSSCQVCQQSLSPEDIRSSLYEVNQSCPYCYAQRATKGDSFFEVPPHHSST